MFAVDSGFPTICPLKFDAFEWKIIDFVWKALHGSLSKFYWNEYTVLVRKSAQRH